MPAPIAKPVGRWFQMSVLTAAAMAAAYAKTAVSPLQETIRVALSLSDNQMALLQGPALALPMVVAALPIGLIIDRHSRVKLLFVLAALNLLCSALTALAPHFYLLIVARCVVGLTAFATIPAVLSLVADLYPPGERGQAVTVTTVGQFGGAAAVFALGGALLAMFDSGPDGWRQSMLWLTAPLALVMLLTLTLREPQRTGVEVKNTSAWQACAELWRYRAIIVPLSGGVVIVEIALGAALVWTAPTLSRDFGLSPDRIGTIMAMVVLLSGVLGSIAGGILADLCQRTGGPRTTMSVLTGLTLLSLPPALFPSAPGIAVTIILLVIFVTIITAVCVMGTTLSTVVIPNEVRGLCLAVMFAAGAIFGVGFAPLSVSLLSGAIGGPSMIGKALAAVCVTASLLGAGTLALGWRQLRNHPEIENLRNGARNDGHRESF